MTIRDQLKAVRDRLAQLDPNNRDHLVEIARLKMQEKDLESANAGETEDLAQQEKRINELMDFVVSLGLFESTVGEQQHSGMGINEYQERREQFNGLLFTAFVEKHTELADLHSQEMQQKLQAINELHLKRISLEATIADITKDRDELKYESQELLDENHKLEAENESLGKANLEHLRRITELESTVSNLQTALENEKKSKTNPAPSKTLQEQIEEYKKAQRSKYIKVRSKEKLDISGREWRITHINGSVEVVNGIDQAKYLVATEDEIEEARFLETQKLVEESAAGNPTLDPIEVPSFPIPQNEPERLPSLQQETDGGDHSTDGKDVDEAGAESYEERLSALEVAVFGKAKGAA